MIPETHQGSFRGPNRLWFEPNSTERCEGTMTVGATSLDYTWSFRGKPQTGRLALFGPAPAVRAEWRDSWHMGNGTGLNGFVDEGVLRLFCTYPAGDGPEWGWRIELDMRDPEHLVLRMYNVEPDGSIQAAVDLRGGR